MYEKNYRALIKRYPEYGRLLDSVTVDGSIALKETESFNTLIIKGVDVYKEDPVKTCAHSLLSQDLHYCRLAIFAGFVLGYEVRFYTEKLSKTYITDKIIIIEHSVEVFKTAMTNMDLTEIFQHPQIEILLLETDDILFSRLNAILLRNQTFYLLRASHIFTNFEYFEMHRDIYIKIINTLWRAAASTVMYSGNDCKDSLLGYYNMFDNINEIADNPGVNLLKDKFKGVPAICIAAGPSLDKNIEQLRFLQESAILIAVDAALKPLLKKGIRPHLVTSLEREIEVARLFEDIEEDLSDIHLAACPVVYNKVYQNYKGPRLIVYRSFDHFKWLGIDRGMLQIKTSPGNMNFKIAEYLGCELIILVGQDLAIEGKKTNVTGTAHQENYSDTYLKEPRFKVPGNYSDTVVTTRSLKMMLDGFHQDLLTFKGTCINATEGGAYISKTEVMTLQEASRLLSKKIDVKGKLKNELKQFVPDRPRDLEIVSKNINTSILDFKKSKIVCEKLEAVLSKHPQGKKSLDRQFNKVLKLNAELPANEFTWQLYFAHIGQSVFVSHEMKANSFLYNEKDIRKARELYLDEYRSYVKIIRGLIRICVEDLVERKSEIDGQRTNTF